MTATTNHQQGFTLIELLVAVLIFAIMSVMAMSGLQAVTENSQATEIYMERLNQVQKGFRFLQFDFEQLRPRPIKDEFGTTLGALNTTDYGAVVIEMTTGGRRNPLGLLRSTLRRVGYGLENETLYRYQWTVLDRAQDSVPLKTAIMNDVSGISFRFLNQEKWVTAWPIEDLTATTTANTDNVNLTSLPQATEVSITLKDFGEIKRLFHGID